METNVPNDIFGVFVNNTYQFEITTDADGVAIFNVTLPKGENVVKLVNRYSQQPVITYLTNRDWATWLTAYADQLTKFDTEIETIKRNSRMLEVNYEMADQVWGRRLLTNDSPAYPIDTYREVLQEVQQGYRRFGGIVGGLDEVVSAFTQVNPWMCTTAFGPRWVLGTNFVDNDRLGGYTFGMSIPGWPELDPEHPGNFSVPYNQAFYSVTTLNTMSLVWDSAARKFTYKDGRPNPISSFVINGEYVAESRYVAPTGSFNQTLEATLCAYNSAVMDWSDQGNYQTGQTALYNGVFYTSIADSNHGHQPDTSPAFWVVNRTYSRWTPIRYIYSISGPWDTTLYNWLALDFGQGVINIELTVGVTVHNTTIVNDINAAFAADPRYANVGYTPAHVYGTGIVLVSGAQLVFMPPTNLGDAVPDAAWMFWGVPWILGWTSTDSVALPPAGGTVTLAISNASAFQTPQYPGAYNIDVIYSTLTNDIRLSLPVLELDKNSGTITLDFSQYMHLSAGVIYADTDIYPSTQTSYSPPAREITSKITINVADTSLLPVVVSTPYTTTLNNSFIPNNSLPVPPIVSQIGMAPDGWINSEDSNPDVQLDTIAGWMSPSALVVRTVANDGWTLSTNINKGLRDWSCFEGEYGVWVGLTPLSQASFVNLDVTISLEFISRSTGTVSTYSTIGVLTPDSMAPTQITQSILTPPPSLWDYATLSIQVSPAAGIDSNAGLEIRIDEAYLKIWTHTGLNLGFNTTPRNAKRSMRGYMLYNWCIDELSSSEKELLGLPQYYGPLYEDPAYVDSLASLRSIVPTSSDDGIARAVVDTRNIYQYSATTGANQPDNGDSIVKPDSVATSDNGRWYLVVYPVGHIGNVSPSQVTIDRFYFDTNEYPGNICGVFTDTDLFACSLVNLDVVSRAPSRFSYAMPHAISSIVGEVVSPILNPTPIPGIQSAYLINLADIWDQVLDTVVLYEDRNDGAGPIPITHDHLSDMGPQIIGADLDPVNCTYTINYERLTRITTPVLNLPTEWQLYQWWADWVTFRILDMVPLTVPTYTGLQFDGNYYANLTVRSNMDVAQSLLLRNDGIRVTPIPTTQWNYVNSYTIQIASQAFDAASTYTLQYNGLEIQPAPIPTVVVEMRQGTTPAAVTLAAWETLPTYNTPVKTSIHNLGTATNYPYFQMRMSVSNITDIRFIRIISMLLKGIPVNWWGNKFIDHEIDPGPIPPPPE
jgi:hypothetical protein